MDFTLNSRTCYTKSDQPVRKLQSHCQSTQRPIRTKWRLSFPPYFQIITVSLLWSVCFYVFFCLQSVLTLGKLFNSNDLKIQFELAVQSTNARQTYLSLFFKMNATLKCMTTAASKVLFSTYQHIDLHRYTQQEKADMGVTTISLSFKVKATLKQCIHITTIIRGIYKRVICLSQWEYNKYGKSRSNPPVLYKF